MGCGQKKLLVGVAVRPVIASNGVPFLQMRSVGSHSTTERGRKERMGYVVNKYFSTGIKVGTNVSVVYIN